MARGVYHYIRELWKKPKQSFGSAAWKERLVQWRGEPAVLRVDKPTRLDRARSLGYKAKQGYIIVRSRVSKGTTKRPRITGGRRPKRYGRSKFTPQHSKQRMAEGRAARKYPNMEVLNSYWVGEDGKNKWYEVVMLDRDHPVILASKKTDWISNPANRGRVYRGLTSSGKKARGLVRK